MRPQAILISVGLALALVGCMGDDRLSADTEENFERSFAALTKDLNSAEKTRFDEALRDISLAEAQTSKPELEAYSYKVPTNNSLGLDTAFSGMTARMVDSALIAQWNLNRPKIVMKYASGVVSGHTAAEIIRIADSERDKGLRNAIDIYSTQLEKAQSSLRDAEEEDGALRAQAEQQKSILQQLQVTKPKFYYQRSSYRDDPMISFAISNKSEIPVKRAFFHGRVQTPGRAVPWVDDDFNYEFPGGLEPSETKNLNLAPNRYLGHWGDVPKEAVAGAIFAISVLSFEDASGRHVGDDSSKSKDIVERIAALRKGISDIEAKMQTLRTQLPLGK
jgi:hypothetical protein